MAVKQLLHEIVADIVRVSRELGFIPKRDQYLETGAFSRKTIDSVGGWTVLMHATGLKYTQGKDSREEILHQKEFDNYDKKIVLLNKFEKEIKPYHGRFDRLNKDVFMVASYTDSHSHFRDKFTLDVFLDFCKQSQPELIVLGGDNLEFYKISSHNQNPQRSLDMQKEIDFVVENKLKAIRAACPKAQIDYHIGNHELRLFRYLCDKSPALSSLRCLQFNKLLGLDELEINLVGRENFVFKTKMEDNFKVYRNLWAWTHGTDCSIFPSKKELERHGVSGASGHVHRHTAISRRDVFGFKTWMTVGSACTLKTGEEYMPSLINWENGFLLSFIHPNGVNQQHISTEGGYACAGGTFYTEKRNLETDTRI